MPTWKGKTRGGVAGYRFFIFLLKNTGLRFSYFFLRFVVLYFVFFAPSARNPIYSYFRKIHHFSRFKSIKYVFKNFYALGKVLLDKVSLLSGIENPFTFDFEGEEYLHEMAALGGGFLIGAHIGNWEIAGELLKRVSTKVHIVMVENEYEQIKNLLNSVMTEKSLNIIPVKEDLSHLIAIKRALQNNELIAIHGDRFTEGARTVTTTFLGYKAELPYGPFYLALRYNKPVTFVSAVKETNTHYHFQATPPKNYGLSENRKQIENEMKQIISDYTSTMERILKRYPEQWFNYYYFWDLQK